MESSMSIITAATNSNEPNDSAPPPLKEFKTEDSSLPAEAVHGSVHSGDVESTLPTSPTIFDYRLPAEAVHGSDVVSSLSPFLSS